MNYFAVIRLTADQDFCVEFPDFPGLERSCASIVEAQRKAAHALREALGRVAEEGKPPPDPTTKQELESRPEYRSSFLISVGADPGATS